MKNRLYEELFKKFGFIYITYGYQTKCDRISRGLLKSPEVDAYIISKSDSIPTLSDTKYIIKQIRRHNRQIHKSNILKGGKLKKNQTRYILFGYRLKDIVKYHGEKYYIAGRRDRGCFNIRPLNYNKSLDISYKNLKFLYEPRRLFMFYEKRNIILIIHKYSIP